MLNATLTPMNNLTHLLCCPVCSGNLAGNESRLECQACGRGFPVRMGIPDFRLFPPSVVGYSGEDEDLKLAEALFEAYETASFEDLVRTKIASESRHLAPKLQDLYVQYRLENRERAAELVQWIRQQTAALEGGQAPRVGLDIGCGSGGGMAAVLEVMDNAVGIDIALSELILAKKFLSTYYPGRQALLVAGVAEHLPFASGSFSLVTARDILEHVASPKRFIHETHRVLLLGGSLVANTDSRYVWIEPHTLLPGVGYLPRVLQPLYVRWARRRGYKIHLPSVRELKHWLRRSPFGRNWRIIFSRQRDPRIPPRTRRGRLIRAIPGLFSLMNGILAHLSSFEVIAQKSE